jgi:hypothetical protein
VHDNCITLIVIAIAGMEVSSNHCHLLQWNIKLYNVVTRLGSSRQRKKENFAGKADNEDDGDGDDI